MKGMVFVKIVLNNVDEGEWHIGRGGHRGRYSGRHF